MSLNLNSLRKIPMTGADTSNMDNISPISIEIPGSSMPEISGNTTSIPENIQKNTPVAGPKISLMKLKKASGMENAPIASTETTMEKKMPEQEIHRAEKDTTDIGPSADSIQMPEIKEEIIVSSPVETFPTEEAVQNPEEPRSILLEKEVTKAEDIPQKAVESKEFFPNFHISDEMNLDKDLLNLQDFVTTDEYKEPVISEQGSSIFEENQEALPVAEIISSEETSKETLPTALTKEDTTHQEIMEISTAISAPETIAETLLSEEPPKSAIVTPTPEYVAEVKTELSEQRRAGFRFFIQKKTKIIAGVSLLVLSVSAVALFSGSLLPTDIQKSGKSNIQEEVKNTVPEMKEPDTANTPAVPTETENPSDTEISPTVIPQPSAETPSYEMGRDYSVAKNTKKNIRSNTPASTSTGGEMPTP